MSLRWRCEDALRELQAFAGVGVIRTDFDAGELRDGELFGGVVEEDERERVAGILRADEMRESHGDAFCGGEAVFTVEDHGVRAVEHDDGGAGALVFGLMHLEVAVLHVEREGEAFAGDGGFERGGGIEVEGVAELIGLRAAAGFDAGGIVARVVAAEVGFAERTEQVAQGFVAEEVEALVGDFEARFSLRAAGLAC